MFCLHSFLSEMPLTHNNIRHISLHLHHVISELSGAKPDRRVFAAYSLSMWRFGRRRIHCGTHAAAASVSQRHQRLQPVLRQQSARTKVLSAAQNQSDPPNPRKHSRLDTNHRLRRPAFSEILKK